MLTYADVVSTRMQVEALPEAWRQYWSRSRGRHYYRNLKTGETSWDRPPSEISESVESAPFCKPSPLLGPPLSSTNLGQADSEPANHRSIISFPRLSESLDSTCMRVDLGPLPVRVMAPGLHKTNSTPSTSGIIAPLIAPQKRLKSAIKAL